VRYTETGEVDSMLLLTADPDLTEIDWPRYLEVPQALPQTVASGFTGLANAYLKSRRCCSVGR
jgi:hypothetical protein